MGEDEKKDEEIIQEPEEQKQEGQETLDTKISMECGLSLCKEETKYATGAESVKYFAKLHSTADARENMPEDVYVNLPDLEIEIPEKTYNYLLEQRGTDDSYGMVHINLLYKRPEELEIPEEEPKEEIPKAEIPEEDEDLSAPSEEEKATEEE